LSGNPNLQSIEVLKIDKRFHMTAITVSAYSRTSPRGAVVAADVFVWLLDKLHLTASRPAQAPAADRVMPGGAFPA
jgi:hypothetical protein